MPRLNEGVTGLIRQAPDELPEVLEAVGDLNPAQCRRTSWISPAGRHGGRLRDGVSAAGHHRTQAFGSIHR